ncbi:MAG: glucose 1-dehydrogenase [Chloroflexi bacterium]|nr:glucose 1-dehydrogenase [Chloroflexota bacterium]
MRLRGKVAIVTGAGSGIGRAIALRLAEEGAKVVAADIDPSRAEETAALVRKRGGEALAMTADVARRPDAEEMVRQAVDTFGGLDVLVANAGILIQQPFLETTDEAWERTMNVDLKGVFLCGQAAARRMAAQGRGGKIVNIASVAAEIARPQEAAYTAAKAGVVGLTRAMAVELAPHHINVNAIAPAVTTMTNIVPARQRDESREEAFLREVPWDRLGLPEDVANAAVFLASNEADYITGATLAVDGGRLAYTG